VELNVKERIIISSLVPQKSNYATYRMFQDLLMKVGLSADEIKESNIRTEEGGNIRWDNDFIKDFEFKDAEVELIAKYLKELDKKEELSLSDHISLYEKFVKE